MIDIRWINRTLTMALLAILLAGGPLAWHFGDHLSQWALAPVAQAGVIK